jgi:peptidoglycan/xylan/chitin deacetylase (PgdA/CDA1 family)
LFDYFRVPYARSDAEPKHGPEYVERTDQQGKALFWVAADPADVSGIRGFRVDTIPVFGQLVVDDEAKAWLDSLGGKWHRSTPICDLGGTWIASVWTDEQGRVFLPFDPNQAIECYWKEGYSDVLGSPVTRSLRTAARRSYYRVRPAVPRPAQILIRRWFSRVQSKTSFPGWPVETALHDLYAFMFALLEQIADEPVPMIAPWPEGFDWAFVLTHDVETTAGYENVDLLCDIEISAAYRSSWNFVPRNHHVLHDSLVERLQENGFEIGVHGLYHDGRDISDLDRRLPLIRAYAERWNAVGFRSPATLRDWNSMPRLGFDYDSTYFDTSPYEPQPGGCCTWMPYMIEDLVELPITLPQDHTLFEILGRLDEELWLDKARFLRERGGMALVLTHPDYARNERLVHAYTHLLGEFADDTTAWKALPREVGEWWRRRAASELRRVDGRWQVVGPAADGGTVAFARSHG